MNAPVRTGETESRRRASRPVPSVFQRRTVLAAAAAIVLVLVTVGILAWRYRESLVVDAQAQTARLSLLLAEQTTRTFEAADFTLRGLEPVLAREPPAAHDPAVEALLRKRVSELDFVGEIRVLDARGAVVQSSSGRVGGDGDRRGYFDLLSRDPSASIVIGHADREVDANGRPSIPLARRLDAPGGGFDGAIVADIDPSYFSRFFRDLNLGRHAVVSLIGDDGQMLLASTRPDSERALLTDHPGPVIVQPTEVKGLDRLRAMARSQITSVRKTEGYPLSVSVGIDPRDLAARWWRIVGPGLALTGLIIALIVGLAVIVERNRAERARALQRAIVAQRLEAMGQMTASVSHDFRNVLTVMQATVRLLRRRGPDETVLAAAEQAIERGNAIVDRLLAFSRRQDLDVVEADVNGFLRQLDGMLRHVAGGQSRLVLALGDGLPPCRIDRAQFDAAMMNLVVNARQAMPSGGTVTVATRLAKGIGSSARDSVVVTVTDTGCGIDEATLKRVFEPFFTTKLNEGTGLGLAQVYGFMRQIGGDVTAESTVGSGSTFSLHFPVPSPRPVTLGSDGRDRAAPTGGEDARRSGTPADAPGDQEPGRRPDPSRWSKPALPKAG